MASSLEWLARSLVEYVSLNSFTFPKFQESTFFILSIPAILLTDKLSMMVTETKDSATVDIVPDGDVILVVGIEMKRLRAYSLTLKSASTVFRAMLGPRFSEGQKLNDNGSTEIDMPEDDAEAMEIMLNVIHGCNNKVHDALDASRVLRVAITADKFDCKVALAFAIRVWLNCANVTDSNQLWQLLKAAYWFDNPESFEEISLRLMLHHQGSYLQLWARDDIDADILIKICRKSELLCLF